MKKILIIDDEADWIKVLIPRLEHEDYEVVAAFDPATGIKQIKDTKPDLILLDIMMPSGGGMQVLKYVRASAPTFNIKVIIITARSDQETRDETEKVGISGYFVKPIDTTEVLKKIKETLFPAETL